MVSEGADMGLQISVRHTADVVVVDLFGKATIGRANEILNNRLRQLIDDGTHKILVNRGASLKLLRPRGNVRLVLETLHLLEAIPSAEDEAEAISSFR
jgi:hypothetical protein